MTGTYVKNCYVQRAPNDATDWLFWQKEGGEVVARLDGYAVIPMAVYEDLVRARDLSQPPTA